jgi:hypothetical protein
MELAPNQRLFNLGQFVNDRLKQAASAFEEVISAPQSRASEIEGFAARGEFHETLWWLTLGVDLGYFPDKTATLLFAHYRALISHEHERYIKLESNRLQTWQSEWSEKERLRNGLLSDLYGFDAPSEFLTEYQTALLISESLSKDPVAGACMRAVTFLSDETWFQMQHQKVLSERVYFLLTPRAQSKGQRLEWDKNLLVAGAIQLLSHMETYKQFFEDLDAGTAGYPTDSNRFRFRVADLQAWRLNLQNSVTESRFHELIDASTALVDSELKRLGHELDDANHFHDVADDLIASWKTNVRAGSPARA